MALGAGAAYLVELVVKNPWVGMAGGMAAGLLLGLLVAVLEVNMGIDQVLLGVALILLGPSVANYLVDQTVGGRLLPSVATLAVLPVNQIFGNPVGLILRQNPLTYIALILGIVIWVVLFRTHIGLKLRAVGEDPRVASFMGVHIKEYRFLAVVIGTMLAALGGAFIIVALGAWVDNLTAGRGFIAIAVMRIGGWKPQWVVLFSFIFGLAEASSYVFQAFMINVPAQIYQAIPYALGIVVLVLASKYRRWAAPKSLGFAPT